MGRNFSSSRWCLGVVIYPDDILIFRATPEEHNTRLEAVREALRKAQVTINDRKSMFNTTSVPFLCHMVSAAGIAPGPEKVASLQQMLDPTNLAELRAFLGLATYLGKFVPNMAATVKPLTRLLSNTWCWDADCTTAADLIRHYVTTAPVLGLFDPNKSMRIEVDASGGELGAVLAQQLQDGWWQPVYYASRKLTGPESRYAAIELETLVISWADDRFRGYVTGMPFCVITDHRPLLQVFATNYPLSRASLRVQRLILRIQDMSFTVKYRPGRDNLLADALFRLPTEEPASQDILVHHITLDDGLPTAARQKIAAHTTADPTLCAVRDALRTDKSPTTPTVPPYRALRHELSIWPYPDTSDFIILRDSHLVIPDAAISEVLERAHEGHPGLQRTKARLRESVWWPGWSKHAKQCLKTCDPCCPEKTAVPVPLKPRELPPYSWHTIAVDLFY